MTTIIEMKPTLDAMTQTLAWRNAYDHGFRLLTGRFKMEPASADAQARHYATRFWRDWLPDNDAKHPLAIAINMDDFFSTA